MLVTILCIVILVIALLAVFYCFRLSTIYSTFNKNVKAWTSELDKSTNAAINRQAMSILKQLDEKVTNLKTEQDETIITTE